MNYYGIFFESLEGSEVICKISSNACCIFALHAHDRYCNSGHFKFYQVYSIIRANRFTSPAVNVFLRSDRQ